MDSLQNIELLTRNLPDPESARRFFAQLQERHPAEAGKLSRSNKRGLLSDILALAAWSPFLATTMLQHKDYFAWLERKRGNGQIPSKEDLLESLARFSATNSQLDPHVLLSRFRRRELLRIYLHDIRRLATTSEITTELSNLADAILEFALKIASQELENRYGAPLETDARGRGRSTLFSIVALGKLGSRELNYASDIDLLFLYSSAGTTSGIGTRGGVTNKEFFVKLSERASKIVGQAAGEGAAYRVDLRLRPYGRVGALAISVSEAVDYYQKAARDWERQVLLRARSAAGDEQAFRDFYRKVESSVYRPNISVPDALESVRLSKQKINREHAAENGFNVKLGGGGIREIEFIAQALQLAYGGNDEWLRVPHTLISLSRLADRGHIRDRELTELSDAYFFLRSLEHRLQMENGLQTHVVPDDKKKRELIAQKMDCPGLEEFDRTLLSHTKNVSKVFKRVFENHPLSLVHRPSSPIEHSSTERGSLLKSAEPRTKDEGQKTNLEEFCEISTHFAEMLAANPQLGDSLPSEREEITNVNYVQSLAKTVTSALSFREELAALRALWSKFYLQIAALDAFEKIEMREANRLQTALAEASLSAALMIVRKELARKFNQAPIPHYQLPLAILGLGRLGGRGMDYGSDLDLVLIYDETQNLPFSNLTHAEFYGRAAEILVTALSSLTREGYLYRVDLRLRPDGKNGATVNGKNAFLNYLETRAAIWELLAYVKLRAVGDDFAAQVETAASNIIYARAKQYEISNLKSETRKIRDSLEQQKAQGARRGEIDIKHGAGGLLDIYFAVRFLQLRDSVFDQDENRTTSFTLQRLRASGSLDHEDFEILSSGYDFLRKLDHALRLVSGRSTRLPHLGNPLLSKIAARLKYDSTVQLVGDVSIHLANVRATFEKILA